MVDDTDIDSWKTKSYFNGFDQKRIALIDHCAHSDEFCENSTSTGTKSSSFGPGIRYINAAIYTESVGEEEHDVVQIRGPENDRCCNGDAIDANHSDSNPSTTDLPSIAKDATNVDHVIEHPVGTGQSTYRCHSTSFPDTTLFLEPSTARSAVSSGTIARVERRCKIGSVSANIGQNETIKRDRYVQDNRQVTRISTTSLSVGSSVSDCQISNGPELCRRIAHSEWIRKKHETAQRERAKEERAARKRQEEVEKVAREKEERARLEKENFLKWVERKRQQELDRKAMLENELELQRRLKEIEDKAAVAKTLYLRQWVHKKKEEQKARHKEQEMRQRKMDEERERRLEQSSKAYEKWRENSKNKPKPATQGLLPHQKAKPAYVNPIPWQSVVEIDSDELQKNAFNDKKGNVNQLKMSGGKTIAAHQ